MTREPTADEEGEEDEEHFEPYIFVCIRCGFESEGEGFRSFTRYCDPCLDEVVAPLEAAGFRHHMLRWFTGSRPAASARTATPKS